MRNINLTPAIFTIVGILIFLWFCAHYSDDEGILGSIANILYYLWRKFWVIFIILAVLFSLFFPQYLTSG